MKSPTKIFLPSTNGCGMPDWEPFGRSSGLQKQITNVTELASYVGKEVGVSDWLEVSQERINQFANATEDRQWIHVDPERAARESPFQSTIAHGFLTLSLLSELGKRAMSVGGVRLGVNYGLNRVRFVSPVPAGSNIRARFTLAAIEEIKGGVQA